MNKNYRYPLDISWSTEELASVLSFLNDVEQAYEEKITAEENTIILQTLQKNCSKQS